MNRTCNALLLLIVGAVSVSGQGGLNWGQESPTDSVVTVEGNSQLSAFRVPSTRFQQVYAASDFTSAGAGVWLHSLYFRVDGAGPGFSGIASNLAVRMSTTLRGPDSLSPVFAENLGADLITVMDGRDRFMGGTYVPRGSFAQDWSTRLDFDRPFLYQPQNGNLLLDIQVTGGAFGQLDAWLRDGDSVGSVRGERGDLAGNVSTIGFATLFVGIVVPEPRIWWLWIFGFVLFFVFRAPFKAK